MLRKSMIRKTLIATFCASAFFSVSLHASAATYKSEEGTLTVDEVVGGLQHPWAVAFLPEGHGMLVTERTGNLRLINGDGKLLLPISGVPKVWVQGQGGLLDVELSPDFAKDRMVYLTYAEAAADGKTGGTAAGRGRLSEDMTKLEGFTRIFQQQPKLSVGNHFGSRIVFDRDGFLFIALGENNNRPTAQDLDKLQGKIVRLYPDGSIPNDNPFVGQKNVRPEIWSYGHRNQQGAALNPWTGTLWTNEHGPMGGDEINIIERGANYGWPISTFGIDYNGQPISESKGEIVEGVTNPFHVWKKSPAISGMAFYNSDKFKQWDHNIFIGALAAQVLIRLELKDDKVVHEERLLGDLNSRIRDVRQGPDGYLYVLTDEDDGKLLKVGLAQ